MFDEMNFTNLDPEFVVYIHTSPKGKRYVGITSRDVHERWGMSGNGYKDNKYFYAAIQLYGWDAFRHDIIAKNLSLSAASAVESSFIKIYNTMNPDKGYNQTSGGNWSRPSAEVRERLSAIQKQRSADPIYRAKMSAIQKRIPHKPLSEIQKQRISQALKGRPSPLRGRKLSESHRAALCGRIPWNKGKTKYTDSSLQSSSKKLMDREFSPETLAAMSISRKSLYANGYSPIWINDGNIEKQIDISNNAALPKGFTLGRLSTIYVTDGCTTKKVRPDQLDNYLASGWKQGKSDKINSAIKKSRIQYIWTYDNQKFERAADLADYLRTHGYPNIVGSTITNLYNSGFEKSKIYNSLAGKITREVTPNEDR